LTVAVAAASGRRLLFLVFQWLAELLQNPAHLTVRQPMGEQSQQKTAATEKGKRQRSTAAQPAARGRSRSGSETQVGA